MRRPLACTFVIAAALGTGACASTGATPRPFPTPVPTAPVPGAPAPGSVARPSGAALGYSVAGSALGLRGTPYRNGGTDPSGFDCSGLVNYVFAQNGVRVPRTVSDQFRAGRQVDPAQIEAGDLVFFSTVAPGATHVGISIGGDEFVHAPSGAGEVRVERLSATYWASRFVGARRVL
jgi:cell wall-associated NlpC family hydrolase